MNTKKKEKAFLLAEVEGNKQAQEQINAFFRKIDTSSTEEKLKRIAENIKSEVGAEEARLLYFDMALKYCSDERNGTDEADRHTMMLTFDFLNVL